MKIPKAIVKTIEQKIKKKFSCMEVAFKYQEEKI